MNNNENNELGKRIKEKREALGWTMEMLGQQLGVNRSTIKRYEDGETKRITFAILEKIATVLQTTTEYFFTGIEPNKDTSGILEIPTVLKRIPVLGVIRAGNPIAANEEIDGYTFIDAPDPDNYFALRVTGDSMNAARIYDGDIVICRRQNYVEDGQIAVVLVDNCDATVKKVYRDTDKKTVRLEPQSTNGIHRSIIVNLKTTPFEILGKVVRVEFSLEG